MEERTLTTILQMDEPLNVLFSQVELRMYLENLASKDKQQYLITAASENRYNRRRKKKLTNYVQAL
jgi:hypothetical protein